MLKDRPAGDLDERLVAPAHAPRQPAGEDDADAVVHALSGLVSKRGAIMFVHNPERRSRKGQPFEGST